MKKIRKFFFPFPIQSEELVVVGIGVQEKMSPGIIHRPRGNDEYLFMYFYDDFYLQVNGHIRTFKANEFVLWKPGSPHYYGHPDQTWNHSWIRFGGNHIGRLVSEVDFPLNTPHPLKQSHYIDKLLYEIYEQCSLYISPNEQIVKNYVENLIREVYRSAF